MSHPFIGSANWSFDPVEEEPKRIRLETEAIVIGYAM
jgi:hypothetical protein